MKYLFAILFTVALFVKASTQGCVAIRSNGGTCTMSLHDPQHNAHKWSFSVNNRYFKSYKHFVGKEEQKERVEANTEVINQFFSTEFDIGKIFNDRWSMSLFIPLTSNARSSLYQHYGNSSTNGNARNSTHSFGIGDVRLAAYYWLLAPVKMTKANIQSGLGLKLPTGDYRYQDYFYKNDNLKVLGPVDQSIQLGDGGTGISLEVNSFYSVTKKTSLYFNGYYLANPRQQNRVSTARG